MISYDFTGNKQAVARNTTHAKSKKIFIIRKLLFILNKIAYKQFSNE